MRIFFFSILLTLKIVEAAKNLMTFYRINFICFEYSRTDLRIMVCHVYQHVSMTIETFGRNENKSISNLTPEINVLAALRQ